MDERLLNADLRLALELADVAAAVTLSGFGEQLAVKLKEDATPVTEVDRAAERAIRQRIEERSPGDGVLGEEEGFRAGTNGRLWVLDPIDGTRLYVQGLPLWTTLIALQVDGEAVLGVADVPAIGQRYHAARGRGAWRDGRRLAVSHTDRIQDAFVAHSGLEEWARGGREAGLLRVVASAQHSRGLSDAWAHLLVAQGSVDAALEHEPCYLWDWTATRVIVEEAGGRMTTLAGGPPESGGDLLVTNGLIHDPIVTMLTRLDPVTSRSVG